MKNSLRALLFVLLLLMAPAALAQDTQPAAPTAGTVEDLAPPPSETPPSVPAAGVPASSAAKGGVLGSTSLSPYGLDMLWALGAFILVMVLLYLTLKALGRMGRFRGVKGRQSVFELRGIQPLDNRKYLAAVEVEGRLIVVGVTPDRITPVAHWFLDDEDDQVGLNFSSVSLGPDPGPSLEVKLPEEDHSPLDISVADLNRDPGK